VFCRKITDISAPGESSPKEHENDNDENIWLNLNESRNDNQFELPQTVKYLKEELQNVKDNERILKAQEGLNNILLSKGNIIIIKVDLTLISYARLGLWGARVLQLGFCSGTL